MLTNLDEYIKGILSDKISGGSIVGQNEPDVGKDRAKLFMVAVSKRIAAFNETEVSSEEFKKAMTDEAVESHIAKIYESAPICKYNNTSYSTEEVLAMFYLSMKDKDDNVMAEFIRVMSKQSNFISHTFNIKNLLLTNKMALAKISNVDNSSKFDPIQVIGSCIYVNTMLICSDIIEKAANDVIEAQQRHGYITGGDSSLKVVNSFLAIDNEIEKGNIDINFRLSNYVVQKFLCYGESSDINRKMIENAVATDVMAKRSGAVMYKKVSMVLVELESGRYGAVYNKDTAGVLGYHKSLKAANLYNAGHISENQAGIADVILTDANMKVEASIYGAHKVKLGAEEATTMGSITREVVSIAEAISRKAEVPGYVLEHDGWSMAVPVRYDVGRPNIKECSYIDGGNILYGMGIDGISEYSKDSGRIITTKQTKSFEVPSSRFNYNIDVNDMKACLEAMDIDYKKYDNNGDLADAIIKTFFKSDKMKKSRNLILRPKAPGQKNLSTSLYDMLTKSMSVYGEVVGKAISEGPDFNSAKWIYENISEPTRIQTSDENSTMAVNKEGAKGDNNIVKSTRYNEYSKDIITDIIDSYYRGTHTRLVKLSRLIKKDANNKDIKNNIDRIYSEYLRRGIVIEAPSTGMTDEEATKYDKEYMSKFINKCLEKSKDVVTAFGGIIAKSEEDGYITMSSDRLAKVITMGALDASTAYANVSKMLEKVIQEIDPVMASEKNIKAIISLFTDDATRIDAVSSTARDIEELMTYTISGYDILGPISESMHKDVAYDIAKSKGSSGGPKLEKLNTKKGYITYIEGIRESEVIITDVKNITFEKPSLKNCPMTKDVAMAVVGKIKTYASRYIHTSVEMVKESAEEKALELIGEMIQKSSGVYKIWARENPMVSVSVDESLHRLTVGSNSVKIESLLVDMKKNLPKILKNQAVGSPEGFNRLKSNTVSGGPSVIDDLFLRFETGVGSDVARQLAGGATIEAILDKQEKDLKGVTEEKPKEMAPNRKLKPVIGAMFEGASLLDAENREKSLVEIIKYLMEADISEEEKAAIQKYIEDHPYDDILPKDSLFYEENKDQESNEIDKDIWAAFVKEVDKASDTEQVPSTAVNQHKLQVLDKIHDSNEKRQTVEEEKQAIREEIYKLKANKKRSLKSLVVSGHMRKDQATAIMKYEVLSISGMREKLESPLFSDKNGRWEDDFGIKGFLSFGKPADSFFVRYGGYKEYE